MAVVTAQALAALERANEIRLSNAAIRREIMALPREAAAERVAELLRDPSGDIGAMYVGHLLRALPRFGPERSRRLITRAGLAPGREGRRLRELTARERSVIASLLVSPQPRRRAALSGLQADVLRQLDDGSPQSPRSIAWALGRETAAGVALALKGLATRGLVECTDDGWRRT